MLEAAVSSGRRRWSEEVEAVHGVLSLSQQTDHSTYVYTQYPSIEG